ncbi:Glycoside hydrolase family 53 domain protein [Rhodotorula toruloides]|nr:Glycoside hydrolase family 53 domain protein [Rhodotorula toruloides]
MLPKRKSKRPARTRLAWKATMAEANKLPRVGEETAAVPLEQQQCIAEVKELFGQVREGTLSLDDLEEQVLALIEGVHERERALVAENQTLVSKATAYDDMRKEMQKIFELSTT